MLTSSSTHQLYSDKKSVQQNSTLLIKYLFGDPHAQYSWHPLYQDVPDPGGHPVGARLPVVEVEHDGGEADGDRHQDHREQEVAPQQRQRQARGRDHLKHGGQALPHPQ